MDHQEKLKELLSQLTAIDDIGSYMNNLIEDYKKNFNEDDDKINKNYIKFLESIGTLSIKEKNKVISC